MSHEAIYMRTITETERFATSIRTRKLLFLAASTECTSPKVWALEKDVQKSFKKMAKKEIRELRKCWMIRNRIVMVGDEINSQKAHLMLSKSEANSDDKSVIVMKIKSLEDFKSQIDEMHSTISKFIYTLDKQKFL